MIDRAAITEKPAAHSEPTHILSRLHGVIKTGPKQWQARCPAHNDNKPSLGIQIRPSGGWNINCLAGCDSRVILRAIGFRGYDALFPDSTKNTTERIVATYQYHDAKGIHLFDVVRFEPKNFRQRAANGTWSMAGVPRVLYRLPELFESTDTVYIVEGEKDADNLHALGLTATCNPGGAGKWKHLSDDSALNSRDVVIIVDKDEPGRAHARDLVTSLTGRAKSIRCIELPGAAVKDGSDWISAQRLAGLTDDQIRAALLTIIDGAAETVPSLVVDNSFVSTIDHESVCRHHTDVGNASRFFNRNQMNVRHCYERGKWLVWIESGPWAWDDSGKIIALAKQTALDIFDEVKAETDDERRKAIASHALKTQKKERLSAMVDLSRPDLAVPLESIDADDFLFGCVNGVVDLQTGKFLAHCREQFITCCSRVRFDQQAQCPTWNRFLQRIMDGNNNLIAYLQRLAGLCATGSINVQELFILHGDGSNGKSVFIDTLAFIFGDYFGVAPESLLIARQNSAEHPTEIAGQRGKRVVVCSETEEGGRLRIQLVKKMTGDALLSGRFMRCDYIKFRRTFKLILVTNNRPDIRESTNAIWRRIRLIPFNVVIDKNEIDESLLDKLKAEAPGILNWIIAGCLDWQRGSMQPPTEVLIATQKYQADADPLAEFIAQRLIAGDFARVSRADLLAEYQAWAHKTNERHPMERTAMFDRIRRLPDVAEAQWKVSGKTTRGFTGVGICKADESKDDVDSPSEECPI